MRLFLARFSESVWSGHLPSWADFTTTPELKFLVPTPSEPTLTAHLAESDLLRGSSKATLRS
jgi:hypothetical protein